MNLIVLTAAGTAFLAPFHGATSYSPSQGRGVICGRLAGICY